MQRCATFILRNSLRQRSQLVPRFSFALRAWAPQTPRTVSFARNPWASFHTWRPLQKEEQDESVDPKHQMLIGFTCEVCKERSHHVMSKLAYTKGVVLIECPGCKNRHLIADNLGWFRDSTTTVEDLVKEKGEAIRKVIVDDKGVEHQVPDIMEWLPDIGEEERVKKEKARQEADRLRQEQESKQDDSH
ncbi:zf-DNL-domain-containing protein [Lichtheimia hyalospora FSU 10163]|nr:zf-DNL-domain-containing protein [Lichtheimia hyalospora FSU 10163]